MNEKDFCHLHLHSDFSLLDGAIQIKPLAKRAQELGARAVAVTDHGNMYGAISFYNQMKGTGIKPIIGMEAYIARGKHTDRGDAQGERGTNHIILLAKNLQGYRNIAKLSSFAFTKGYYYKPRIDKELLAKHSEGIVALSACLSGVPSSLLLTDKFEQAAQQALEFQDILGKGNYFLEVQNHGLEEEVKTVIPGMIELSKRTGIPLAATNDCHYLNQDDWRAHDILVCIGAGKTVNEKRGVKYKEGEFYVRSAKEMWLLFGKDMPEALLNTVAIAEMCELELPKGENHLPVYRVPDGETIDSYFARMARAGLEERWQAIKNRSDRKFDLDDYKRRLEQEIEVITKMGFPGYFLIVWDFINYAKRSSIPVGPGRGSAAGSLVAYCLKITDVDPLQYDLLFERFLNPDRVSMPDIDIDFCVRGRDEVIRYVTEKYGRESVAQIVTFGTMASKAAIKDVGRALDMPYADVEKIAKLIPPPIRGRNVSITQALETVPELKREIETNPTVKEILEIAQRLEGCARHSSVHAAGVVISPLPLQELIPVAVSGKEELTTQYVMSDLEKTGMLKMDFLALTALTVINDCLISIKQVLGKEIKWSDIALNDAKALAVFAEGRTEAVFQFESSGMQEICRKLKPKGLEDLAALNALYRPGPLDGGMVDDFIERHHGKKSVRYLVPEMKEILSNTYGIMVYQEQIMQLAQKLAGYSLGEADLMRRAMGKKQREEMALHEKKFVTGALKRGIQREKAEKIFSLMAQFSDYGFNRSHSVAYAYLAFQTAYLKAHYPEHFYAAVLSSEAQDAAKVFKYSKELRAQRIALLPPDVNESHSDFTPLSGAIRYGLTAIKGLGQSAVNAICEARESGGPFRSFFDFAERIESATLNKRVFEGLVSAGAFDSLKDGRPIEAWRGGLFNSIDAALSRAQRAKREKLMGQNGLFGAMPEEIDFANELPPNTKGWTSSEMLAAEKAALGFYITGHPLERYLDTLQSVKAVTSSELAEL